MLSKPMERCSTWYLTGRRKLKQGRASVPWDTDASDHEDEDVQPQELVTALLTDPPTAGDLGCGPWKGSHSHVRPRNIHPPPALGWGASGHCPGGGPGAPSAVES